MSKERARRRAEREAAQARQATAHAGRRRRAETRRRVGHAVSPRSRRRPRADSLLRRRRRRQDVALLAVLLLLNALLWTQVPDWKLRVAAAVLSLLVWPLLVILVFDRRPSA